MKSRKQQLGIASGIAIFAFLVIISSILINTLGLTSDNLHSSTLQTRNNAALFMAESALEQAAYQLNNGTACGALDKNTVNFGRGSFQLTQAAFFGLSCLVKVQGQVDDSLRILDTRFSLDTSGGNVFKLIEAFDYADHAAMVAVWTETNIESPNGSASFSTNNCSPAVCPDTIAGSGSISVGTSPSVLNAEYRADWDRTITDINATGGALTGYFSTALFRDVEGDIQTNRFEYEIAMVEKGSNEEDVIWSSDFKEDTPETLYSWQAITIPAGRIYDRVRIKFDLRHKTDKELTGYMDEIRLIIITSGTAPWQVVRWSEIPE